MTDVSYANLNTLIGQFKQAAIDAWMKTEDPAAWNVAGDKYEDNSSVDTTVTRPGADGEGGGNWESDWIGSLFGLHDRDEEYQRAFNNVRTRIDNAVNKWKQLPDPATIANEVEDMRQASRMVALTSVTTDGKVTGSSNIVGNLNGIQERTSAMGGGMIAAFQSKFLLQLGRCIAGHHAITLVLGGALSAQENMWREAREDVARIVDRSRESAAKIAQGDSMNWEETLKAVGWAVKGVGLFAKGPAVPAVSLGIEILTEAAKGDDKAKGGGGDYESMMKGFEGALDKLAAAIKHEETLLRDNLTDNKGNVEKDRPSYDLDASPLLGTEGKPGDAVDEGSDLNKPDYPAVIVNAGLVKDITRTFMPAIATDLGVAAQKAYAAQNWGAYHRDGSIGVGASGVTSEWFDLDYLLYELEKQLEWEVTQGATTLDLAVADLMQTDADVKKKLDQHAKKVDAGSIFNPWD